MRCPKCGQRLVDGAHKCPVCGTVFAEFENNINGMGRESGDSPSYAAGPRCPKCGQRLMDGAKRCPICGEDITAYSEEELYPSREAETSQEQDRYAQQNTYADRDRYGSQNSYRGQNAGFGVGGGYDQEPRREYDSYPEDRSKRIAVFGFSCLLKYKGRGMAWNFFLSNIALVLSAATNMLVGIQYLTGTVYGTAEYTQQFYDYYPGIKPLDMVYGLFCFLIGVAAAMVRLELVYLRRKGPKHLMLMYIVPVMVSIIYLLIARVIIGQPTITWESGYQLIFSIVMVLINRSYYRKREDIFCN